MIRSEVAPWHRQTDTLLRQLAQNGIPLQARDIYQGRNRVVSMRFDGEMTNIKEFKIPHLLNRFIYTTFRRSKARRAFDNAIKLRNLGFNTPEPHGWLEIRHGLLLGKSYFVSQQLIGFNDLRNLDKENIDPARFSQALGKLIARLHTHRILMKDLSPGNVLWQRTPKGDYIFFLVDINRMEFEVTSKRKLLKNFDRLLPAGQEQLLSTVKKAYYRNLNLPICD